MWKNFKEKLRSMSLLKIGFILITYVFILFNIGAISEKLSKMSVILTPFVLGFIIAYLMNPVVTQMRLILCRIFKRDFKNGLSMFISYLLVFFAIFVLFFLILPQVWQSLDTIIKEVPCAILKGYSWIENEGTEYVKDLTQEKIILIDFFNNLMENVDSLMAKFSVGVEKLVGIVADIGRLLLNFILGCLISIYMLINKDKYKSQAVKGIFAFFDKETAVKILDFSLSVHTTFSKFLMARIVDSIIIGCLCYVCCLILGFNNSLLISFIVGITNVIPYFGPFLGAIPSALIVLLQSPGDMVVFCIFILVLQQFDGNILGPKLLGDSLGLTSLWIIFAVMITTALFGIVGMVIGVPLFAIIYMLIKDYIDAKLVKKGLPTESEEYLKLDLIKEESERNK